MGFYPPDISAYVELASDKQETLMSHLRKFGYMSFGVSAARRDLWNMANVYRAFGFDVRRSIEDMRDLPTWRRFGAYDDALFERAMSVFKTKPKGTPGFMFITTMQNHGPYKRIKNPTIKPVGYSDAALKTFLTGLKMSDDAVKKLLTKLQKEDEDYVVAFFGDHFPMMNSFTDGFLGSHVNKVSEETYLKLHSTPFFIWTNYKSKTELNQYFGLNYLSTKVMEMAEMPKSQYMKFHDSIKDQLVCLARYGYCGPNGAYYPGRPESNLTGIIKEYHIVQHYMVNNRH